MGKVQSGPDPYGEIIEKHFVFRAVTAASLQRREENPQERENHIYDCEHFGRYGELQQERAEVLPQKEEVQSAQNGYERAEFDHCFFISHILNQSIVYHSCDRLRSHYGERSAIRWTTVYCPTDPDRSGDYTCLQWL